MLAVLVNGMQNDIIRDGRPNQVGPLGRQIIPDVRKVVHAARSNYIPVVYVNACHSPQDPLVLAMGRAENSIQGTEGYDVIDELAPQEGDFIVNRRKLSGFFGTDLNIILKDALKVNTIVMTGGLLEFGMYASILDASQLGYSTMILSDCCSSRTEERGRYVLELLGFLNDIKIVTGDEFINRINSRALR